MFGLKMATIYIDSREKISPESIVYPFKLVTMTKGDYAIVVDDTVMCIFERKTPSDYAASIKDGRIKNIEEKMLGAAAKVYIILEGPIVSDETEFGGIKYKTIRASMNRYTHYHNIHQMFTKDMNDTLKQILDIFNVVCNSNVDVARYPQTRRDHVIDSIIVAPLPPSYSSIVDSQPMPQIVGGGGLTPSPTPPKLSIF